MPTIIRRTETVAVTDKRGGVINAGRLLGILSDTLFHPQLLAHDVKWKHLNSTK